MAILVILLSIALVIAVVTKASAMTVKEPAEIYDYAILVPQKEKINTQMFLGIIKAESNFQPNARNPVGTASGVLQYLDSTFLNYCIKKYHMTDTMEQKNNPAIQINCAIEMLKEKGGYKHWNASFSAWGYLLQT